MRLQELLVNRYIPDMGGNTYAGPAGNTLTTVLYASGGTSPYGSLNIGNMVANLPAPGFAWVSGSQRNEFHPQLRYLFLNPDTETIGWTPAPPS